MTKAVPVSARAELAPSGTLRVGINAANFLLVSRYAAGSEPHGIAPDLGRELGKRLGVPVSFVVYDSPGKLADAGKTDAWDVAFLGNEPQRASEIAFTAPYVEIPVTYLVPQGSPIATIEDIDRDGVRIAVMERSAYDLFLSNHLKHAQLQRASSIDGSYDLFVQEGLDALAGLKPRLVMDAEKLPGSRILDGQVTSVRQSAGTLHGRENGAKYLREFIEQAKSSGLVARLIEHYTVRGVSVAPAG
ncbi:MAG: ABC transporter substrate-binding protein [Betaproteobacteria bacterium SG8_40]|jgi:polar amino acid transport system substrate-binding protein|nr:MAG: ABC transporter substrate-binding protein [Betaproteobacteria bacterium SG8_40]